MDVVLPSARTTGSPGRRLLTPGSRGRRSLYTHGPAPDGTDHSAFTTCPGGPSGQGPHTLLVCPGCERNAWHVVDIDQCSRGCIWLIKQIIKQCHRVVTEYLKDCWRETVVTLMYVTLAERTQVQEAKVTRKQSKLRFKIAKSKTLSGAGNKKARPTATGALAPREGRRGIRCLLSEVLP